MQVSEKKIREHGELVALNRKPECGHFYQYKKQIYRAMPDRDECVYPILAKSEFKKMIKNGILLPAVTIEEIEKQIDETMEIAKSEPNERCLLKSVNVLKAKLNAGTFAGLMCNEPRIKAKFAELQKAAEARVKTKPRRKERVKK